MLAIVLLISQFFLYISAIPIAFTQIDSIRSWWPETNIARSIGVPTYSDSTYNYVSFQVWTCASGFSPVPTIFAKPLNVFGSNFLGTTDLQIRTELKKLYKSTGSKVILGVFGDI
jgi:hypothetical protein